MCCSAVYSWKFRIKSFTSMSTRSLSSLINRQVLLKSRPVGIPNASNFTMQDKPISLATKENELLIRNIYLSVEPAMRGWVSQEANYSPPMPLNSVMKSFAVGEIIQSNSKNYSIGQYVTGLFGWQQYSLINESAIKRIIKPSQHYSLSANLGVLGINGLTAYFGLKKLCEPINGNSIVISTAAGSVGSIVSQLARLWGSNRIIGLTSSEKKKKLCIEKYGYNHVFNYKQQNWREEFKQLMNSINSNSNNNNNNNNNNNRDDNDTDTSSVAADYKSGVDIYWDNVSGPISDSIIPYLNPHGRIAVCGTSSIPSWLPQDWPTGPRLERHLLVKRAKMSGLLVFDYESEHYKAIEELSNYLIEKKLISDENILQGIESAPSSIELLYKSENTGKLIIQIDSEKSIVK